ncbi:MAG: hypothetical protein QXN63_02415 [Candidatus Bathyarchaeia archaeon]
MTKEAEKKKLFKANSGIWKVIMILIAALLTFAGPTYAMYVLVKVKLSYPYVSVLGFLLFFVGVVMFLYLFKKGSVPEKV